MVAIVSGNGLGLLGGSAGVLGSGGQTGAAGLGQAGEGAWINAKTGNLLLQRQDELLAGRGPDIGVVRTYNSQGGFDFDNGDSWQLSLYRKLASLTGTVNTAGSTIKRFEADGSQLTYTYDATLGKYVNRDGSGAYDTLSYDATGNTWTWRDGDSGLAETFEASPTAGEWRIKNVADRDGNTLTYGYDTTSGLITSVQTANGETTLLQYNASRQLTRIDIVTAGNVTTTRVRYEYESTAPSARLLKVVTDLTPQDGSVADNNTFVTTYTYHGTTTRVASITHGDGTQLSFTYDGSGRVQTYTDGSGAVTTLTYNSGNTTVTDALGQVTTLYYDSTGNLTRLQGPAGSGQDVSYTYNARGDVTQVTDSRGNVTVYGYDSQGNRIREQDAAGTVIERDYNASNQLVRQTVYAVADPDGVAGAQQAAQAQSTHYLYDDEQHLRFVVSPEGRVTEYKYDGFGQQSAVIQHAGTIDLASLGASIYTQDFSAGTSGIGPTSLPAGIAWVNGALAFTSTQQATTVGPSIHGTTVFPMGSTWRFEITTPAVVTDTLIYAGIDAGGWGAADYRRHRAYFSNGKLYANVYYGPTGVPLSYLGEIQGNTTYVVEIVTVSDGSSSLYAYKLGQTRAQGFVDHRKFEGMALARFGAQSHSGASAAGGPSMPGSTNTIVLDNLSVTTQAGLSALETWSASQDQRGSQRTDYIYDARGLLRQSTGYTLITAEGLGTIASQTYYVRDAAGRVLQSIDAWGMNALSSSSNADLLYQQDSAGRLTGVVFDKVTGLVKDVSARDTVVNHLTTYVHDGLGRLIYAAQPSGLGQAGYAEQTLYDGANRRVTVVQSDGLRRVSAYDQRGLLVSQQEQNSAQTVLSGASYQYDAAGRLRAATDAVGGKTYYLYDGAGRQTGRIDAAGSLTEFIYNNAGQVIRTQRYANAVTASLTTLFAPNASQVIANVGLSSVRPAANASADPITRTIFDEAGRERFRIDERGFVVESRYDGAGRLIQTLAYARALNNVAGLNSLGREPRVSDIALLDAAPATSQIGIHRDAGNDRITRRLYDADGLLRGELDAVGYLTEYRYDARGQMVQRIRHAGPTDAGLRAQGTLTELLASSAVLASAGSNLTERWIYDSLGQVTGQIDAEGYYTRHQYDANGNRIQSQRYATRADAGRLNNVVSPVTVRLRLSGTTQGGAYPQVQVKIDGVLVGTITLDSTAPKDYTLAVSGFIPGRDHNVSLVYLNDTGLVGSEDRNLFLHGYNLTTPVIVQNASWAGVQLPGNTDLTIAVWAAADGLLPYGGEVQTTRYGYTVRNQLAWQQAADGTVSRIGYDAAGRVVSSSTGWTLSGSSFVATDVRGQQQRYDLQGRLTGELNALGVVALAALGSTPTQAQVDAVWAAYGTRHEYDAAGRRTRTTDANGNQTLFFYDAMGRITYAVRRVKNPDPAHASEWVGEASKREYNALGQLTRERQMATFISATRLATLTGGAQSQITSGGAPTESADDRVIDYTYHLTGQIKETKTYLDASTSQIQTITDYYTGFGQLQSSYMQQVTGRSRQDQFGYDRRGLLTWNRQDAQWGDSTLGSGANANAYVLSQGFDAFGRLASRIDVRGVTERYGYDKLGRQIAVRTDPDDATGAPELNRLRQMAFDAFDRVIKQTDALGKETLYSYDTANRTVTVTTPEGIVTKTTHNRHGEAITLVDGLGNETRFGYDKNGNLVSEKRWDKTANVETTVATHGYDTAGLLKLSTTDANGNVVAYTYDAAGRVLTRKVGAGTLNLTTTYQYDAKGQAVKVTDANGNVTQTTFDRSGRVIEVAVDPASLNLRTRYEYDLDGHVLTLTEGYGTAEARRTAYEYDNLGRRIKQVVDPDAAGYTGLKLTTTWTYDGNNNVVARIDGVGTPEVRTTRYTYDALDRLTDTIDALGGVTRNEYDLEGRIVRTTAYAQAINMATFGAPATYTLPLVTALLNQTDPNNRVSRSTYDRDGRLRFVIDALGAVTERQYDAAGNLSTQVRYANALAGTLAANTLPQVVSTPASSGAWIVTSAADRTSTYTYDAFNRLIEKRDGVGATDPNNAAASIETTESWAYDKVGNVIRHTDVRGQREWFAYDKANRVVRHIDQGGYVTDTWYSINRTHLQTYWHPVQLPSPGASGIDEWASEGAEPDSESWRTYTQLTYNRAGRLYLEKTDYTLDPTTLQQGPNDTLITHTYDALGQRIEHKERAGTGPDRITRFGYDLAGRLASETVAFGTAAATTTQYGYDALSNQIRIIDARGVALAESDGEWARTERRRLGYVDAQGNGRLAANLTETDRAALRALYTTIQQFDTTGRKLAVTDALGATTRTDYNALGDIVTITDALGKIGYFYTDALGRVTLQVGPDGAVTRTTFDLLGNQTATSQYANRLVNQGAVTTAVRPQIVTSASGVAGPYVLESTADAQQIAVFDALGRTSTIQTWYGGAVAEHYTETFAYDAAGNVLSATARNGALTTYQYDALGRKTREVLPVTSKNASGVATAVENRYAYDSEGHLSQKIEAYGLPEQRTTTYEYDGLGRQIRQTGDTLTVFDPAAQTSSVVTPTATRSYDLAGNLLEEIDAAGARTLHFYDAANREIGRVDALGYYTAWTYDPAGNKVGETRYAQALTIPGSGTYAQRLAGLSPYTIISVLAEAPAPGSSTVHVLSNEAEDRTVAYRYDSQGRQIETRIAELEYGLYTQGEHRTYTGDAVTLTAYDALGNVIRQTDANDNVTRSYYNAAGQKVGQLDAAGYLTVWTFDAQGRTTKQTRYANQVANWASSSDVQRNQLTLAGMSGALANATQDRVTDYTHDALGRVLTETAKGVNAGTLDANGVLQAGTVADAVTTYTYNGLDKVTSRTDATNARTDWTYDGIGRVTRIEKPQFTDFEGTQNVRPTTDTEYDGLNNVVREIQRGKNNASEADDRITQYVYGAGGYLSSEIDPTGAVTEYAIDVMGRFTREVLKNRQNAAETVSTDDVTRYRYDLMGRQTHTIDGGTYNSAVRGTGYINESGYNGFGDVIGKRSYVGTAPTTWQEFAEYDKAGRVWKTNSGDGITKVHVHDANGNTTLTVTGPNITANLSRTEALQQTGSYTINTYDPRNQLIGTIQPTNTAQGNTATIIAAGQNGGVTAVAGSQAITTIIESNVVATSNTPAALINYGTSANYQISVSRTIAPLLRTGKYYYSWGLTLTGIPDTNQFGSGNIRLKVEWRHGNPAHVNQPFESYHTFANPASSSVYLQTPVLMSDTDTVDINSDDDPHGYFRIIGFEKEVSGIGWVTLSVTQSQLICINHATDNNFYLGTDYIGAKNNALTDYDTPTTPNNITIQATHLESISKTLKLRAQPNTASIFLFYRSNSSEFFTLASMAKMKNSAGADMAGWFSYDWSLLSGGNYEIQYVALDASGNVLSKQSGSMDLRNPATPILAQNIGMLGSIGGSGRGLLTSNARLHFVEQGLATALTLRYRVKDSGTAWDSLVLTPTLAYAPAGWFSIAYENYFASNTTYEIEIEARKANGELVNMATTEFSRNASGTPSIGTFVDARPITVRFTDKPAATRLEIRYRPANSTGAFTSVWVNVSGTGLFNWDATSLVANRLLNYDYEIETLAYEGVDGLLINHNRASLRLGATPAISNASTVPVQVLRLTPPQAGAQRIEFGFRLKGSTGSYTGAAAPLHGASLEFRAELPATALTGVEYEYRYLVFGANDVLLGTEEGAFTLSAASAPVSRLEWVLTTGGNQSSQITRTQAYNAFGEVVTDIDGLGHVTDFEYNTAGLLTVKREAETDVTLANGYTYRHRPLTRYTYDTAGRLIQVTDANGHKNTQTWLKGADDENQIVLKRQADGGTERQRFDVFGQLRQNLNQLWDGNLSNELPYRTDYEYDKSSRLTKVTHEQRTDGTNAGQRAIDQYLYDVADNRIRHTNALGQIERTDYDSLGRVTQFASYGGAGTTTYGYAWDSTITGLGGAGGGGWVKTEADALGRTQIDTIDLYGRSRGHKDLGGRQFTYAYNAAGWLVGQTGDNGQNIAYEHYANGFVKGIWDKTLGSYTEYRYDNEGNRSFEGYISLADPANLNGGVKDYYQYATIEYDELNRIKVITDPKATIRYEYDAVGNRRRVHSQYHDGLNGAMAGQDYWYAYDEMNRFTITMGALNGARATTLSGTTETVYGSTGIALSYDLAGQRTRALNGHAYLAQRTEETYLYTRDGYLDATYIDINLNDAIAGTLRAQRTVNLGGQTTTYREWNAADALTYTRTTTYDADGRKTQDTGTDGTTDYYYYNSLNQDGTDDTSNVASFGKGELAKVVNNHSGSLVTTWYAYEYWDEAKQMAITNQGYNPTLKQNNAAWKPGYSELFYDVNGHLTKSVDRTGNRTFRYTTDAQGLILTRDEIAGSSVNRVQRYYYVDSRRVGDVGNDGPSRADYAQAMANRKADKSSYKNWKPIASADFDQNYEPVGIECPAATAGSYTVRNGDTLQSIARAVWGDAAMWYLIADANGLTGSEALTADTVLTLPNKVTNIHNNSTTFRPYNPAEAMGDVSPTLPDAPPPPRKKKKCGGLGIIIVAVVAVVATAAVVGALSGASGLSAISTGFNVMGGVAGAATAGTLGATNLGLAMAIGGAVGSVAGQLTGMALGVQDKFSWGAVATSALTTALAPQIAPFGKGSESWVIAGNAAARSVVNQGVNIVTGQQKGFSWAGVAASAIAAPIMHKVGNELFGESDGFGNRTAQWTKDSPLVAAAVESTVNALVSATTHIALVGGKVQWAAVAADALSSFVGQRLSEGSGTGTQPNAALADEDAQAKLGANAADWSFANDVAQRKAANADPFGTVQDSVYIDSLGMSVSTAGWNDPTNTSAGSATEPRAVRFEPGSPEYQSRLQAAVSQLQMELVAQDEQAAMADGQFLLTGGASTARVVRGPTMVINRGWDAALNIAGDPIGFLGELPGLMADLAQMNRRAAKRTVDEMRQKLIDAGVKNLPDDTSYISANGSGVDYQATLEKLGRSYEDHIRDQRLRETWGDNYQSIRLGKSGYTVQQFQERSLNLQQDVMDRATRKGLDLIATGELPLKNGSVMLTLGNYADDQIRTALRTFYRGEGLSESTMAVHVAVNRKISNGLISGIPDLRMGSNLLSDSTLAYKTAELEQIRRWVGIRENAYTVVVRPSFPVFPNYKPGSWVIAPRDVTPLTTPATRSQRRL